MILSATVEGKAVADNQQQKHCHESQVGILDGPLWLGQPVGTLSINGQVQGHPPLGYFTVMAHAGIGHL